MRLILCGILLFLLCSPAKAQQNYFVYIQSDTKQPFIIRVNDKTLTSSATGYVVIPKLTTGAYNVALSFPGKSFSEQKLALNVGNDDGGYLLKDFGEKGWGLYNVRTMELTMNGGQVVQQKRRRNKR